MVASHTSCRGPGCSIWWPLTQVVGSRMQYMVASHTISRVPQRMLYMVASHSISRGLPWMHGGLSHD